MCGRVMLRVDPNTIKQLFNSMEFRNQDRYRFSYNAGPMRFLPIAYNTSNGKKAKAFKQTA